MIIPFQNKRICSGYRNKGFCRNKVLCRKRRLQAILFMRPQAYYPAGNKCTEHKQDTILLHPFS